MTSRSLLLLICSAALLVIGDLTAEWLAYFRHLEPRGTTLPEVIGQLSPGTDDQACVRTFDEDGRKLAICIGGATPPGWVRRSGDPQYVFDQHGRLLEWTSDNGDAQGRLSVDAWRQGQLMRDTDAMKEFR